MDAIPLGGAHLDEIFIEEEEHVGLGAEREPGQQVVPDGRPLSLFPGLPCCQVHSMHKLLRLHEHPWCRLLFWCTGVNTCTPAAEAAALKAGNPRANAWQTCPRHVDQLGARPHNKIESLPCFQGGPLTSRAAGSTRGQAQKEHTAGRDRAAANHTATHSTAIVCDWQRSWHARRWQPSAHREFSPRKYPAIHEVVE